jgi:glucose-1-phosphate thymidylyltransferase
VLEKPANPPNNFAVTGIYLYGPNVFFEAFPQIERSPRGEYEISSIHSHLLKTGKRVGHKEITGWWKDTGKPEDLLAANELILGLLPMDTFPQIGARTTIAPDVQFDGPVVIGENCVLESCVIGPFVSIGSGSVIRGAAISRSIILPGADIQGDIVMEHSILGRSVTVRKKTAVAAPAIRLLVGDKTVVDF